MKKKFFSDDYNYFTYTLKGPQLRGCISKKTGEVWFASKDVCQYLGYHYKRATVLKHYCPGECIHMYIQGEFRPYKARVLSANDVIRFACACKRPGSSELVRWVSEKFLQGSPVNDQMPHAIPQEPVKPARVNRNPLSGLKLDNLASTSELELLAKAFLVSMDILKRQQTAMEKEKKELRASVNYAMRVLEDVVSKLKGGEA